MELLWDNKLKDATLTASSEEVGHPVTNLADTRLSRTWRSTGVSAEWVKIALTTEATRFAIMGHNLAEDADIKLQANITDDWNNPPLNQSLTWRPGVISDEIPVEERLAFLDVWDDADDYVQGIAYGANMYIAVGTGGLILKSTDRITWTPQTPGGGFSSTFYDVTFDENNELFVAVGIGAEIQTSPDGETWTQRTAGGGYSQNLYGVIYGNNLCVAVGDTYGIQTSPDGITWTQRTPGGSYTGDFRAAGYGNGIFIISGIHEGDEEVQRSTDGITWTVCILDNPQADAYFGIEYTNDIYYVSGDDDIQYSSDGSTWVRIDPPLISGASSVLIYNILYRNGLYYVSGYLDYGTSIGGFIATTIDFSSWSIDYILDSIVFEMYQSGDSFLIGTYSSAENHHIYLMDYVPDNNYPYWRLLITDTGSYIDIGSLYLGDFAEMSGMDAGQEINYITTSGYSVSGSGQLYGNKGYRFYRDGVNFSNITADQKVALIAFFDEIDINEPFIMILWEDDPDIEPPIYCHLTQDLKFTRSTGSSNLYSLKLQFEEVK